MLNINVNGNSGCLVAGVFVQKEPVLLVYTTRYLKEARAIGGSLAISKQTNTPVAVIGKDLNDKHINLSYYAIGEWETRYQQEIVNHDTVTLGISINKRIGDDVLITTNNSIDKDVFNYLLSNTIIPIQLDWMGYIIESLKNQEFLTDIDEDLVPFSNGMAKEEPTMYSFRAHMNGVFTSTKEVTMPIFINGEETFVELSNLKVFQFRKRGLEEALKDIISKGIKNRLIWISEQPVEALGVEDYDSYIQKFSTELSKALDREVIPLNSTNVELKATALRKSRLYKPQRGCVNAIARAKEAGRKFVIATEEMGCGKTKQSISAVEEYFNSKWLKEHPETTLKDCFESKQVSYRTIITGPGHIVEKWGDEIRSEIPDAKVYIIKNVDDFAEIKRRGKARNGKEFYVISKDSLKLGSFYSPIPQKVNSQTPKIKVCKTCLDDNRVYVEKPEAGNCKCPKCSERNWVAIPYRSTEYRDDNGIHRNKTVSGLVCPHCNELLIKPSAAAKNHDASLDSIIEAVLQPEDFAGKSASTKCCYLCGHPLWGVDSKTINNDNRNTLWRKIKHFVNLQRKGQKTAFVYAKSVRKDGDISYPYIDRYLVNSKAPQEYTFLPDEAGVRRVAPAEYIKKYLKGYFDICILDECHKFEGGGSAQSIAAAALVRASKFTIGLTGTIANGKADSFFWLLWMLMPDRMQKKGYSYDTGSMMRFVKKYGSTRTAYKVKEQEVGYNMASRGKQMGSPKIAPGISPLLFVDFLLENCVFLDMSDMSDKLPQLNETVVPVEMPTEILQSYKRDIDNFKSAIQSGCGMTIASTMLMYSLSYPDYPFKREKILSPIQENIVLVDPQDFSSEYENNLLPKEVEMINIVKSELSEGRRCFVFASFTGENSPLPRWKSIIERECNLLGRVAILESTTVKADKREQWIHDKAEEGIEVVICNCKLVETGLDFCFYQNGEFYNYPTILFMQTTYELAVLWQASHRHYRLNQPEECRTYWLAYENTLQMSALEIMAEKIVAVSAIQGKFSSGALTAMAKGVDARLKLAESLKKGSNTSYEDVKDLFAKAASNDVSKDIDEHPMATYFEVMGIDPVEENKIIVDDIIDIVDTITTETTETAKIPTETSESNEVDDIFADFLDISAIIKAEYEMVKESVTTKKSKKKLADGQLDLFGLFV